MQVFERLRTRVTSPGGSSLYDVIRAGVEDLDSEVGVFAPDPDAYKTFWPLLKPIIATMQGIQNDKSVV